MRHGVPVRLFVVVQRVGDEDAALQVELVVRHTVERGEPRQLIQRDVHPERARHAPVVLHLEGEIVRHVPGRDQFVEQQFRVDVCGYRAGAHFPPVLQAHAHGPAAFHHDALDRRADFDLHAVFPGRPGHRLGDAAHAAPNVSPGALYAVDLAEHVVQEYERGAARSHGLQIPHLRRVTFDREQQFAAEPLFQIVPDAHREELDDLALQLQIQFPDPVADDPRAPQVPEAAADVRRRLYREIPQHVGCALDHCCEFEIPLHIVRRLGGDLRREPFLVVARQEVVVVGAEYDGRVFFLLDVQPMPLQFQFPDDLRMQQADRV